jgi:MOSC domain-containing protein YiiM
MDALIPGLQKEIFGKRGILTVVLQGGNIKLGDSIRLEP